MKKSARDAESIKGFIPFCMSRYLALHFVKNRSLFSFAKLQMGELNSRIEGLKAQLSVVQSEVCFQIQFVSNRDLRNNFDSS